MTLDWQPEEFAATGNITSDGGRRVLRGSPLDPLTILVRETVQNSWDAALEDSTVSFGINLQEFNESQKAHLRERIFDARHPSLGLESLWGEQRLWGLHIGDRSTTGLGGPTRADRVSSNDSRDFVDFLRNIGHPRDVGFGGGTYGFGKSSLYAVSKVRAILVHTRCAVKAKIESRFMGAALGPQYPKHTGRHWWGRVASDGVVEPLRGKEADEVAGRLGMAPIEETGTNLLVLQPMLGLTEEGERSPEEAMAHICAALMWFFWPKMVPLPNGSRPMQFSTRLNGEPWALPDPLKCYLFAGFVDSLRCARQPRLAQAPGKAEIRQIACLRPQRILAG